VIGTQETSEADSQSFKVPIFLEDKYAERLCSISNLVFEQAREDIGDLVFAGILRLVLTAFALEAMIKYRLSKTISPLFVPICDACWEGRQGAFPRRNER